MTALKHSGLQKILIDFRSKHVVDIGYKMSFPTYFKPKTVLIICCIHSWYILLVLGGCQRTNPGWITSEDKEGHSVESEHLTAPFISFVPGNNTKPFLSFVFYSLVKQHKIKRREVNLNVFTLENL